MSDPTPLSAAGLPPHLDPRRGRPARGAQQVVPSTGTGRGGPGRALGWLSAVLSLAVLLVSGLGYELVAHYNGQISHIPVIGVLPGMRLPAKAPHDATNYLIVGSDSRVGASGIGTQGTGADVVTGQRSDIIILVHLYGSSNKAQLVSFPRDSYVQIPAYTDPATHRTTPAHFNKLNSSFALGGPPLLIATLERMTDIRVDHYVQIGFAGFKGMVNQLGGVDVCLTHPAKDTFSGIDLSAGQHHIDGEVALSFVRQRHELPNGDIDRIARQQQFIGSLVRKTLSAGTLLNPFKLNGFLDIATHSLTADQGLSVGNLKDLALRLRSFSAGGVIFTTVPITDIGGFRPGAGDVVLLDDVKARALYQQIRDDRAPGGPAGPGPTAPPAAALTVPPAGVRISVFNGSGVSGLGRRGATDLAAVGFDVVGPAATRGTGAATTTVLYGPTRAESARTVAAALPGSVLTADSSLGSTVQVVLGASYAGATKVTVAATPAPATSPAPTPPASTAATNTCTA